ncbi:hypothetical protein ACFO3D_04920 [Virgibacillus kekensis]|uniref:Uncharacterized protein n=1 Tax=Virgibacillus kekensis TaxID=202261 RepID=A0ABV9DI79_9BACI
MGGSFVVEGFSFIFIAGMVSIILSILLRSFLTTFIQVILLAALLIINSDGGLVYVIGGLAQFALTGLIIFKYIMAIEMNYQLVMEKTHQIPVNVSGNGDRGSRFSFWQTK